MMRSYLGLSVVLSFCLMLGLGCGGSGGSNGGAGGTAGTGGSGGSGATGGSGGTGGAGGAPAPIEKDFSLGCSNSSPIGAQSILPAKLNVAPSAISAGADFDAALSGTATFPESFLDAAQDLAPGGLRQAELLEAQYIVQVRSGATGGDATLGVDLSMLTPGEVRFCNYPPDQECAADSECTGGTCNAATIVVDLPTSDDCAPGGVCDMLGKATDPTTSQCGQNGFCITGGLDLPLLEVTQTYTADASGDVLFGFADQGLTNNTFDAGTGYYTIPKPVATEPIEQGLKVKALLVVGIECVMGTDQGEDPDNADNTLVGVTPDSDLISFPIAP